jgi:hypothetical protein
MTSKLTPQKSVIAKPLNKKGKPTSWFTLYYTLSPSGVNVEKDLKRVNDHPQSGWLGFYRPYGGE